MREEFVMNLSLKTDVTTTNRKLKDYQLANSILVDPELQDAPELKAKAPKRVIDQTADRSGLVRGLRKTEVPKQVAKYDPFMGMPVSTDYFTLHDNYDTGYSEFKTNKALVAGGYDFVEALQESLVRAFAGFGVFIEEEKGRSKEGTTATTATTANSASDDVF